MWVASIPVTDFERSLRFYRDLLGLPVRLDGREFDWMEVGPEEPLAKIGMARMASLDPPGPKGRRTGIVLETDDFEAFVGRLKSKGVVFVTEPTVMPWGGHLADFLDPDGNRLQVVHHPGHYAPSE